MILVVVSSEDSASVNISENILKRAEWEAFSEFEGKESYGCGDILIVRIDDVHLYHDNIDIQVMDGLGVGIDGVVYASRHRSGSGMRTLTAHPLGNYSEAKFGGGEGKLVPASPHIMTESLRVLKRNAAEHNIDYAVSFEATHHGPYLTTPTFFIEIGSTEKEWKDKRAGSTIAQTIIEMNGIAEKIKQGSLNYPVAVGVGGGHYAPRITDVALSRKISFGHIIPTYAVESAEKRNDSTIFEKAVKSTPDAKYVYFHRKSLKKSKYRQLKVLFESMGIITVQSSDLEEIESGNSKEK